jgi:hypothetical protein
MCEVQEQDEIEKGRKALLEYCRMDTRGMARIFEKLKGVAC